MKNAKSIQLATLLFVLFTASNAFAQAVANPPKETETAKCDAANSHPKSLNVAETNLKNLYFLEGRWKIENKENYETWNLRADCSLEGTASKIRAENETITEYLSIKTTDKNVTYQAKVVNQNNGQAIEFVLNQTVKNRFSFENLTHDFPKKIQYTRLDENTLFVEVLGENDRGFSYKMMKQK